MTAVERVVTAVTCLGCGCACDDIAVHVHGDTIVAADRACELGRAWFGDGRVPAAIRIGGRDGSLDAALDAAASALARAERPFVYLAPELSCEAQRAAVALADLLRASIDSVTSATALRAVLAAQERGRAAATLGEVRHRADVLVFWAVDPAVRYPRFWTRYAPEPAGLHVPGGRGARTIVAVDVGASRGPDDADLRVALDPAHEAAVLTALAAAVANRGELPGPALSPPVMSALHVLLPPMGAGRYVVLVVEGEGSPSASAPDRDRADGVLALGHALNHATRGAVSVLRGGGNRSGADAVLAWQTGYPIAVDFAPGHPTYRPYDCTAHAVLARGATDVVLALGDVSRLPPALLSSIVARTALVIGPRASEHAPGAAVVIDTGVAGVHHGGLALRTDDVPLPLTRLVEGPPATEAIVQALTKRIVTTQGL